MQIATGTRRCGQLDILETTDCIRMLQNVDGREENGQEVDGITSAQHLLRQS